MLYHRWKVDLIAVILILATIASCTQLRADDYIVTINTEKAKTIQACVLGTPDNKFVRVCVNRRHYALRYNREWVLEPLFVDKDSVSYKCSCKSYDALKVTKAGQVIERDFYHIRKEYEMEQLNLKQGHIYIGEIRTPKKNTNKLVNSKNRNTNKLDISKSSKLDIDNSNKLSFDNIKTIIHGHIHNNRSIRKDKKYINISVDKKVGKFNIYALKNIDKDLFL